MKKPHNNGAIEVDMKGYPPVWDWQQKGDVTPVKTEVRVVVLRNVVVLCVGVD